MAAARNVSHAASVTVFPSSFSFQASFAAVVVFPDPLTPIIAITMGFPPAPPRPDAAFSTSGTGAANRDDSEPADLVLEDLELGTSASGDVAPPPRGSSIGGGTPFSLPSLPARTRCN